MRPALDHTLRTDREEGKVQFLRKRRRGVGACALTFPTWTRCKCSRAQVFPIEKDPFGFCFALWILSDPSRRAVCSGAR